MNSQTTAPKVLKESKNKIRVEFERTDFWTRFKLKYLSLKFATTVAWVIFRLVLLIGISYVILSPVLSKIFSSFMGKEDFNFQMEHALENLICAKVKLKNL